MPKFSEIGFSNQVVHIDATFASYHVSDEDSHVSLEGMHVGGFTLFLPGPTDELDNLPNDGDEYVFNDPLGLVDGQHPITINGGGFKIEIAGGPNPTIQYTIPFLKATLTFNAKLKIWETCFCSGNLGGG